LKSFTFFDGEFPDLFKSLKRQTRLKELEFSISSSKQFNAIITHKFSCLESLTLLSMEIITSDLKTLDSKMKGFKEINQSTKLKLIK